MGRTREIFTAYPGKPETQDGLYSEDETRLANRNSGLLLETLRHDITPTGAHYLLIHFDIPHLDAQRHQLEFGAGFDAPYSLSMDDIRALPAVTMPVTLECAGNGRARVSPRSHSMPWGVEAVGTSEWTGTPLAPLIERARPAEGTVDFSFTGADVGFDKGEKHPFGRSLTPQELAELDVLLVYEMNGQPLLPQHGAPLRIVVPGWYGMASVKWLTRIEALTERYTGFQQVQTYRYRDHADDPGRPVTAIRVKSLMVPPGVPDWGSRLRFIEPGATRVQGRAWSGGGVPIVRVEFGVDGQWQDAELIAPVGQYAWTGWHVDWQASPGEHVLQCRATDAAGHVQPLQPPWDASGFGNNMVHEVGVFVGSA
ncbi:molybdopterin-dependent oxidoreductase [Thalassococcus lentus]|uniref:Molybdopterin-dependent oxidoreductase n=1 Tax=Thalassococcus lentus TaxID=1210524 RepID=A0ABT4XVY2_9RHOB|nr:molybdopterin-dependent oxidoreductase [Thalassococcus lentus]MDA7426114.1 molybdopterin-dependent oxidoreductase [Thalassococcus lentus]